MMLKKQVEVSVDQASWGSKMVPASLLALNGVQDIDMLSVLTHVALRTAPPISQGFALGDMWAWFRYLPALSTQPDLKLRAEWEDLDAHQKTILSDDWGMGFSSTILTGTLDLVAVCPTNYLISRLAGLTLGSAGGKRGPKKSPDFIGIDKNYKLHIFECKGTQKNRNALIEQFSTGVVQKKNVKASPAVQIGETLVTGVFVPQNNSSEDALFLIQDPEPTIDITPFEKNDIISTIILGELASSFHLFGHPILANSISQGKVLEDGVKERTYSEFDDLETIYYENRIVKVIKKVYKFDYPDFVHSEQKVYGLEVTVGFEEEMLKTIMSLNDFRIYSSKLIEKIDTGQIHSWETRSNDLGIITKTSLGLYFEIKIIL